MVELGAVPLLSAPLIVTSRLSLDCPFGEATDKVTL
jgi:hypothetical protein